MFVLLHLMGPPNKIASAATKLLLLMTGCGAVAPIAPAEVVSDGRKSDRDFLLNEWMTNRPSEKGKLPIESKGSEGQ